MECILFKETAIANVYIVNKTFYLVIPKMRVNPKIEVVIEKDVQANLDSYINGTNIDVIRVFSEDYFTNINGLKEKHRLKSLIDEDVSIAKSILAKNNIAITEPVIIKTSFNEFKSWYEDYEKNVKNFETISLDIADPNSSYKQTSDELSANQRRIQELQELKDSIMKQNSGSKSGSKTDNKRLALNNGHGINVEFNDGFVNVVFLSLVSLVVTVGTIIFMLSILT